MLARIGLDYDPEEGRRKAARCCRAKIWRRGGADVKGVVVTRVSKIVGGILVTILILLALGQYQVHENCPTERRSTTHNFIQ
jgi:hypothetical protein